MPFEALFTIIPLVVIAALSIGALYVGYTVASCASAKMRDAECPSA